MPPESTLAAAEAAVAHAVLWLRLIVEIAGAATIGVGFVITSFHWLNGLRTSRRDNFSAARLSFARYLALALELQLGADVLSTAVAPSWDQIGKLGAIAVIRTALNYFLHQELTEETKENHHAEVA